jgi:hypothetical protein
MKKFIVAIMVFSLAGSVSAQVLNPVQWTFTSTKVADNVYEIKLTANVQSGWHIFSQKQPSDAINNPTEILFNKNPLIAMDGNTRESGNMEKVSDKRLGISANQYSGKVEFIQKVKLKAKVKTNISGSVEYQTCDDKKCLPPKKLVFNVALS